MSKKTAKSPTTKNNSRGKANSERTATKPRTRGKTADASAAVGSAPTGDAVAQAPAATRLPPVGTVIEKRDRHGKLRCKCTVEEGGIRYSRNVYRSLSAAAMAAAKDLGLTNKTQNGFTFWGLTKPPRPSSDPIEVLRRGWERYYGNVAPTVKAGVTDENRAKVLAALDVQSKALVALRDQVA